jgi:hypothetical protein
MAFYNHGETTLVYRPGRPPLAEYDQTNHRPNAHHSCHQRPDSAVTEFSKNTIPNPTFLPIPGGSHLIMGTHEDIIANAIDEFMASLSG